MTAGGFFPPLPMRKHDHSEARRRQAFESRSEQQKHIAAMWWEGFAAACDSPNIEDARRRLKEGRL